MIAVLNEKHQLHSTISAKDTELAQLRQVIVSGVEENGKLQRDLKNIEGNLSQIDASSTQLVREHEQDKKELVKLKSQLAALEADSFVKDAKILEMQSTLENSKAPEP